MFFSTRKMSPALFGHLERRAHPRSPVIPSVHGIVVVLGVFLTASSARAADFDFIIRDGRIVDGTGNPSFHGDVAMKDGKIAALGKVAGSAAREFDAANRVIAPGFIDVHTHAEDIDDQPLAENFLRMGVTTLVLGNCGSSTPHVRAYFHRLEAHGISANVATLIGHGTVRSRAMRGSFMRPPTEIELEEMKALVRRAMEEGAIGLSTGLIYTPGVFAKTEELIDLAKVAAEYGGIYTTHQRSEAAQIFSSLDEIFRIAREAHIPAEISHIKLSGPANWGQAREVLDRIAAARAEGLDITQDQYAYTASSTGIGQLIPDSAKDGGRQRMLERFADPEAKMKIVEEMKRTLEKRKSADYSYAVIAAHKADRSLNGLNIVEAARKLRNADSLDDQIETILTIETNGGATGVFHGMSEDDLALFMQHPNTMFASDSGVRKFNVDVPHPRGYGNNARILGMYVREKKVLRLEDAVRKMSSLPAQTFHLRNRGELREGNWADVVVFDPETVGDHATYRDPHHYATGFQCVFVNGTLVVENDVHNGSTPGKILPHGAPADGPVASEESVPAGN
jgi:N-acyl-D-amino-acid deacylase